MGPKGMGAGALVGGGLGIIAGGVTVGLLKLTGTSMDEVRYWQYKWRATRDQAYKDGFELGVTNSKYSKTNVAQDLHDIKIGVTRVNLDELPDEPLTKEELKAQRDGKSEEVKKSESKKEEKSESVAKESSEKK
jgi:hypothetical protein